MKTFRSSGGPFQEQPYYSLEEIERICADELQKHGLYPSEPSPVRIDRFIEKRFGIHPSYEDLPQGLLGFTRFGPKGVAEIVVASQLDEEGTVAAERRVRSTLAHESGHGLLQGHLFALGARPGSLFGDGLDPEAPKILCRADAVAGALKSGGSNRRYDGRWWEFQANQAMGALLLPRPLVGKALVSMLVEVGSFGTRVLNPSRRNAAIHLLADVFDVNPIVAEIRIDAMHPEERSGQLTL